MLITLETACDWPHIWFFFHLDQAAEAALPPGPPAVELSDEELAIEPPGWLAFQAEHNAWYWGHIFVEPGQVVEMTLELYRRFELAWEANGRKALDADQSDALLTGATP